jgi:hypothetical protein
VRARGWLTSLAVTALLVAAVAFDLARPAQTPMRSDPVAIEPATAGAWYCTAGVADEPATVEVVTASPPGADTPAEVELTRQVGGARERLEVGRVFPGTGRATTITNPGGVATVAARWWDWPAAAARTWKVDVAGLGPGLVSGPCAQGPSEAWYVPGMSTAGGASARVHLANPFATDVTVAVRFTTPTGPVAPIRLENVVVGADDVIVVDLNDHVPGQDDVGVVVESRSGRVVAEGIQFLDPAVGGVEGVALAAATPQLATTWTLPWLPTAPSDATAASSPSPSPTEVQTDVDAALAPPPPARTTSWAWVTNPGEDDAVVTATMHGPDGVVVADLGDELTIAAGSSLRLELAGLAPPGVTAVGVTIRSQNDVAVAVSAGLVLRTGDAPIRTGYAVQLAAAAADRTWILPAETTTGRRQWLHLANPSGEEAIVDVSLWTGASLARPDELVGVVVPAGGLTEVELTQWLPEASHHVVHVEATRGEVVAGRRGVAVEGPTDWVVSVGVPGALWRGGGEAPPVVHAPGLVTRVGTELGLSDADPTATPTPLPDAPSEPPASP